MAGRMSLNTAVPEAYASTLALSEQTERAALAAGVDGSTLELVRLRVSQLNGCGYCLRMHARDALAKGETPDRIAVLPAWRETAYFSPAERAALAIAEDITHIGSTVAGADDDALTKDEAAAIRWVAIVINSFNRIAISSHCVVKP